MGSIEDLPVSFGLPLQLLTLPISFLAGTALEGLSLTHSSRLQRTFCNHIHVFRKNRQLEAAGAVLQQVWCAGLAAWERHVRALVPRSSLLDSLFQKKRRYNFALHSLS